ncbi:hypothetical protein K502DRAFT_332335 [Neoconidiobolus thromboides FSU 785]|nr:hypothetical protein K502DRAFT_332335 [Neoconidiobolus thromboides FSU 785]
MESKLNKEKIKRFSMRPFSVLESKDPYNNNQNSINHPYSNEQMDQFNQQYFQPSTRRRNTSVEKGNLRAGLEQFRDKFQDKANARPTSAYLTDSIKTKDYQNINQAKETKKNPEDINKLPQLSPNAINALSNHFPNILKDEKLSEQSENLISTDSLLQTADQLLLQLLLTQSLVEIKPFKILTLESLDLLKKEKEMNMSKLKVLEHKLLLEIKVRDGAKALIKMYQTNRKMITQAQEQLNAANLKLEEVGKEIFKLYRRTMEIQHLLDLHNGSVLGVGYQRVDKSYGKLKQSIKLRESQDAVKDDIYMEIESSQETTPTLVNNDLKPETNLNNETKQGLEPSISFHSLLGKLEDSQNKIQQLEEQLNQHITSKSSINTQENEVEILKRRIEQLELENKQKDEQILDLKSRQDDDLMQQHEQLLTILEELYSEIPYFMEDSPFSIPTFIERVDGLLQENHDLLDKVLGYQKILTELKQEEDL